MYENTHGSSVGWLYGVRPGKAKLNFPGSVKRRPARQLKNVGLRIEWKTYIKSISLKMDFCRVLGALKCLTVAASVRPLRQKLNLAESGDFSWTVTTTKFLRPEYTAYGTEQRETNKPAGVDFYMINKNSIAFRSKTLLGTYAATSWGYFLKMDSCTRNMIPNDG